MRGKLRERKGGSWREKGEYLRNFTYVRNSLTKQKRPFPKKKLDLLNYVRRSVIGRRSSSLNQGKSKGRYLRAAV